MGKPVVSSVHGMLEAWELRHKRLKKSLYAAFLERPSLERSSCLRALSEREVGDYRRFGCRSPLALIPNGIEPLVRVEPSLALELFPQLRDKAVVLFLGRVHQKKGILNLLQAWKHVARRHGDAHLVVTGPECGDTGQKIRNLIAESDLRARVTITGVLSGPRKLSLLSYARYLCLPSYSEGLSVAVLEALSIGLPSIVTPECNIPLIGARGAGRITANQPAILADTLISCLEASDRERDEMSRAGRRLARDEYDWSTVARSMQSVYEWMLGGNRPACVVE
jgi:poly(glycerol-phosphate) alpha-glucosyltransferase